LTTQTCYSQPTALSCPTACLSCLT
jgi:hypothetical protein